MSEKLVLIPGFANNEFAWTHQIDNLNDLCDIHVYIMDQESTREQMVHCLLKEAPPQFALAGHSMGGWIAQAIAATAPERVTKLILLNTWATQDQKVMFIQQQICEALKTGQLEQILKQLLSSLIHPSRHEDHRLIDQLQTMITSFPAKILIQQLEAMLSDYSSLHHHPSIVAPTLIIYSDEDALFPHEHHTLFEGIKQAQLSVIQECGHASTLEKPEAVTDLMRSFIQNG